MHAVEFHGASAARDRRAARAFPGGGRAADRADRRRDLRHRHRDLRGLAGLFPDGAGRVPDRSGPRVDRHGGRRRPRRDRVRGRRSRGGGGRDRLRRVRALPGGAPSPLRPADGDRHRAHGRRDGDADGLPGGVRAPGRRSSRARGRWSNRRRWRCTRCAAGRVAGQRVLVVGAGPIGLLAAQCARAEGAASVVVSDTRDDRLTLAAALGFPRVAASPAGDAGFDDPASHAGHEHAGWGDPAALAAILAAAGERDLIDIAILCAGGPAAIAAAFSAVRPGGTRRRARPVGLAHDPVRLRRHGRARHRPDRRARLGRLSGPTRSS